MGLFSLFRKNRQESAPKDGAFYSHAEEDQPAARGRAKRARNERNASTDPALPEKKRARRRLIGALALVLAAVIGLPMLLDSQPQQVADDIAIQIPSKDKAPLLSSSHPAVPAIDPESLNDGGDTDASDSTSAAIAPNSATVVKEVTTPEKTEVAKPVPPAAPAKPVHVEPSAAVSKPAEKSTAPSSTKDADAARALALLQGHAPNHATATAASSEKNDSQFSVQVAALASQAKISEVRAKLKHAGISSYTEAISTEGGPRTRIRIGPFPSREAAEKVRSHVLKLGMSGVIVPSAH